MSKKATQYSCASCGSVTSKWGGQCTTCYEWNTISEEVIQQIPKGLKRAANNKKGPELAFVNLKGEMALPDRLDCHIKELNRVCGGGIVEGSAILVGGDPGIGKSTLLLQMVCKLALVGVKCVYVSGEESHQQIQLRAQRLGFEDAPVKLATETNIAKIIEALEQPNPPKIVIIDSIQTMFVDHIESAPGTVTQVRTCSNELINLAKRKNITIILVGHVTKEGALAGPRILEHMVDTVLYFEGDRGHQFRVLRAVKNRFGPTNEIGVFQMVSEGLIEVENPSEIFLTQREENISGTSVLASIEGTRPVLVEIQALVAPTSFSTPRRAVIGWDQNRLAMLLAVLETRCGLQISHNDIYLNIAGGLKINEPAADLAIAAALISAFTGKIIPAGYLFFGEVGLSGEIRLVNQAEVRIKEASKLGFKTIICPKLKTKHDKIALNRLEYKHLNDLIQFFSDELH